MRGIRMRFYVLKKHKISCTVADKLKILYRRLLTCFSPANSIKKRDINFHILIMCTCVNVH